MKNIRVLPTHKPSRLHFDDKLFLSTKHQLSSSINSIVEGRNIYITSHEEIKDIRPHGGKWQLEKGEILNKVIMTTDQDLIKNGVQAIGDEFLEWFVKNPSCEFVEVSYEVLKPFQSIDKGYILRLPDTDVLEEPKQETL